MNTIESISPIWQFIDDQYVDNDLAEIQLLLWLGGIGVSGFNQTGDPIVIQTYLRREQPDATWIEQLITQNAFLKKHAKKVTKLWLSEGRNLLIPNSIFEEHHAESWLRKFHYLESDEHLLQFNIKPPLDAKMMFPFSESLNRVLINHFSKIEFDTLSKPVFVDPNNESTASFHIVCLPRQIILSLSQKGHFIFHLVHPYETPKDVVYKMALILAEKDIPQDQVNAISLTGMAPFWNNILEELSQFFKLQTISNNTTEITKDFLKKLHQCV